MVVDHVEDSRYAVDVAEIDQCLELGRTWSDVPKRKRRAAFGSEQGVGLAEAQKASTAG